uniref:GH16 domain-containing protein n=1 Tax=Gossypium raimondii TaxID=29730 RepID=A0A0D2VBR5_GOSRA|nr:hypothetical protein B456_010G177300 [Gossypium raimondii]
MEKGVLFIALLISAFYSSSEAADSQTSFEDNFSIMWSEDHFKTSEDGQTWYLSLDKETGCGFQTKQRYRFGWFSMKLKLVGGDSAGVVTAYYMCSENGAGPERDELDFEFLGNRTGQPYLMQTNVYKNGVGGREMRHMLWFDPTEEFHSYSILWNNHQIVFFVDEVPIRVFKNNGDEKNDFFPNEKPMYLFSSIWNADEWATRGGVANGKTLTLPVFPPPPRTGGISTRLGIYLIPRKWIMLGCRGTLSFMIIARIMNGILNCLESVH